MIYNRQTYVKSKTHSLTLRFLANGVNWTLIHGQQHIKIDTQPGRIVVYNTSRNCESVRFMSRFLVRFGTASQAAQGRWCPNINPSPPRKNDSDIGFDSFMRHFVNENQWWLLVNQNESMFSIKFADFNNLFIEVCCFRCNWREVIIGSDSGLPPKRRQAII